MNDIERVRQEEAIRRNNHVVETAINLKAVKSSQEDKILEYLKQGYTLSPLDALNRFGCFRLGARIFDLRKQGHDIRSKNVRRNGKTFAEYYLVKEEQQLQTI